MTCPCCKSEMTASATVYTKEIGESLIVVKHVPCLKCDGCGRVDYSAEVLMKAEALADSLKGPHTELAVVSYSAA